MTEEPVPASAKQPRRKRLKKRPLILLTVLLIAALGAGIFWLFEQKSSSPVPKEISNKVAFTVYSPDSKKLPAGYTLDTNSFKNPVKDGITYTVSYDHGKSITFSLQPKPSDDEMGTFLANYLPLRTSLKTSIGEAQIGAYNQQAFVSLPTDSSTWIIITAPGEINQDQLKQVIGSIRKR